MTRRPPSRHWTTPPHLSLLSTPSLSCALLFSHSSFLFPLLRRAKIFIWNVAKGVAIKELSCHADTIYSVAWNFNGSLLATTCKDKKLRVIDPRSGEIVASVMGHDGTKATRVSFLGESNRLFTTGFSKMSERQYAVWTPSLERLKLENIDTASGVLFSMYDPDTSMVYVYGKGDGNIRYFEVDDEAPYIHFLSQFQSSNPQRGICWAPKRCCDIGECEVAKAYKLHPQGLVEVIGFTVPRKSTMFQEDIFPPTKEDVPVLTADEWAAGKNKNPNKISLKNGYTPPTRAAFEAPEGAAAIPQEDLPPKSEKDLLAAWHAHKAEIKALTAKITTYEIKLRGLGENV